MKTLAEQVDEFVHNERISVPELARRAGTTRQNLDNLASRGVRSPKYLPGLAKAMRTSVDALLAGRYVYKPAHEEFGGDTSPAPLDSGVAPLDVLASMSRLATALAYLLPEDREEFIAIAEERAERARRQAAHVAALAAGAEPPPPRKQRT